MLSIEGRKKRKILGRAIEVQRSGGILETLKGCLFTLRCLLAIFLLTYLITTYREGS